MTGLRKTAIAVAATALGVLSFAAPAQASTSYPTTLSESAASVITYGSATTVTGHLTLQGTPFALNGENVSLYSRANGTTAWTKVATRTTDGRGNVAFTVKPVKTWQYELKHAADQYTAGTSSAIKTVSVRWQVSANLTKTTVAHKASDTITATVNPNAHGMSVAFQLLGANNTWSTVSTKTLNTSSVASYTFNAPAAKGTYKYRAAKAAGNGYVMGVSMTLTLTVT